MTTTKIDKDILAQLQSEHGYQGYRILYNDQWDRFGRYWYPVYLIDEEWRYFKPPTAMIRTQRTHRNTRSYQTVNMAAKFILQVIDGTARLDDINRLDLVRRPEGYLGEQSLLGQ